MTEKRTTKTKFGTKIADKLFELTLANGLSATQVGDILGVTYQQASKYLNGSDRICPEYLLKLCGHMKINIEDFFKKINDVEEYKTNREYLEVMRSYKKIEDIKARKAVRNIIKHMSEQDNE